MWPMGLLFMMLVMFTWTGVYCCFLIIASIYKEVGD